jgi:hypothetical protein
MIVRQSFIEAFRNPWSNKEILVNAIKGNPEQPKEIMKAGTEFHEFMSRSRKKNGDFIFNSLDIEKCKLHCGPGVYEIPASHVFQTKYGPVEVTGTADHVRGLVIQDHKLKASTPCAKMYERSFQWICYLTIHQCEVFQYNLFHFGAPKKNRFKLKDIYSFRFYAYPRMELDCVRIIESFVKFIKDNHLEPYVGEINEG